MRYEAILEVLGYAAGHERLVRITTTDDAEIVGTPIGLDAGRDASEVFLIPAGVDEVEVSIGLPRIRTVELV